MQSTQCDWNNCRNQPLMYLGGNHHTGTRLGTKIAIFLPKREGFLP